MDPKRRTNEDISREGWIPVSVEGFPCRVPEDTETVADLRDSLELDDEQELLRIVEYDEEIAPGLKRQGVERLGDPEDPVVVGEGDEFVVRDRREDDAYPHTLPRDVAAFDEDLFKRICNYLGEVGKLDHPARTTELDLRIRAGELVRVTHAAEDPLPDGATDSQVRGAIEDEED